MCNWFHKRIQNVMSSSKAWVLEKCISILKWSMNWCWWSSGGWRVEVKLIWGSAFQYFFAKTKIKVTWWLALILANELQAQRKPFFKTRINFLLVFLIWKFFLVLTKKSYLPSKLIVFILMNNSICKKKNKIKMDNTFHKEFMSSLWVHKNVKQKFFSSDIFNCFDFFYLIGKQFNVKYTRGK